MGLRLRGDDKRETVILRPLPGQMSLNGMGF